MTRRILLLCISLFAFTCAARADVKLPAVVSDGMVLQQGIDVPIWGWADDGEQVTVAIQGQKVSAVTKGGMWSLKLKPLKAGGPYTLSIAGKNRFEFKNVLVGEVWICSGQSNMGWMLKQSDNAEAEIANANYPMIRLFTVARNEIDMPQTDVKGAWKECSKDTAGDFSAVGYFFGRDLHKARNVPVGLINNAVGGSPAESWTSNEILSGDADYKQYLADYIPAMLKYNTDMEKFRADSEKAKAEGKPAPRAPGKPWMPSGLYNGMLRPVAPYAIKGVIWYQGESNAGRAYQYRKLFPTMIKNWRTTWGQGDFPFLFVQLAAFGPNGPKLGDSDWAELREAQTMTLTSSPHTAMALAIDYGDIADIHPKKKEPVGARLALAARGVAYGEKLTYSGPVYDSMKIEGDKVAVTFKNTGQGLDARGGVLKGFIIAGADGTWHEAKAEISGRRVIVSSSEVPKPVAVRYAWAKFPENTLYNKEGLPAVPFRTDTWPGVTQPKAQPQAASR